MPPFKTKPLVSHLNRFLTEKIPTKVHSLALAFSGGSDSTALAILLTKWRNHYSPDTKLLALTVDHQLRSESMNEAHRAMKMASDLQFDYQEILTCKWSSPSNGNNMPTASKIQEMARKQRYELLSSACTSHNIKHLLVAHHEKDQIETFLMRFFRQSGLDGLGCMNECTLHHHSSKLTSPSGLQILRPLLNVPKKSIHHILQDEIQVQPIQDPSNDNMMFDRVRARHAMNTNMKSLSLQKSIRQLSTDIQVASTCLQQDVKSIVKECCYTIEPFGSVFIHDMRALFNGIPKELTLRVLNESIGNVHYSTSSNNIIVRNESLENHYKWIKCLLSDSSNSTKDNNSRWSTRSISGCSSTFLPCPNILLSSLIDIQNNSNICLNSTYRRSLQNAIDVLSKVNSTSPTLLLTKQSTRNSRKQFQGTKKIQANAPFIWMNQWSCMVVNDSDEDVLHCGESLKNRYSKTDYSRRRLTNMILSNMPSIYNQFNKPILTPPYYSKDGDQCNSNSSLQFEILDRL